MDSLPPEPESTLRPNNRLQPAGTAAQRALLCGPSRRLEVLAGGAAKKGPNGAHSGGLGGIVLLARSRSSGHKLAVKAKTGKSVLAWVSREGTVPLSEHERRQFEQIEAALRGGDPRFAEAVRAADPRVHYRRRIIAAALGFLAGVGLLLAGVVVNVILIAVAGFVVMFACSVWAVTSYRRMTGSIPGHRPATDAGSGKIRRAARGRLPGKQAGAGIMGRLEERWRRRQQGGR